MSFHRSSVLLTAAALAIACGGSAAKVAGGDFTAEWTGADSGGISVRPHAVWCEGDKRLKVTAVRGDVGVGLLIYPSGALKPGTFPVFDPGIDSAKRPGVAFAGRWVKNKQVVAFQSDSGDIALDSTATGFSGKFTVRLKGLNNNDTVRMSGHFGRITLDPCLNPAPTSPGRPG